MTWKPRSKDGLHVRFCFSPQPRQGWPCAGVAIAPLPRCVSTQTNPKFKPSSSHEIQTYLLAATSRRASESILAIFNLDGLC